MKYFEVDKTHLPIIIYRINPVEPTLRLHEEFLMQYLEDMHNHPGMITILNLTNIKPLSSEIRLHQVNWFKQHTALMKECVKGIIFVNKSALMTFILKGVFLIQKPAVPYYIVSDFHVGLVRAKKQIQEKSLV